jgi:hypothetical protein
VAKHGTWPVYSDDFRIELRKMSGGLGAVSRQKNGRRDLCEDLKYEVSSKSVQGFFDPWHNTGNIFILFNYPENRKFM